MSTRAQIPYFLASDPELQDQAQMSQMSAPPPTMSAAPVNPHDTLTMPIGPPAPEPAPMMAAGKPSKESAPKMSANDEIEEHERGRLMSDYKKDADPYGSPDNHPGFFGKLLHGLSVATGGVNRRGAEERGIEHGIEELEKDKSQEGLQGATAGHLEAETPEVAPNAESLREEQGAQTKNLQSETAARDQATAQGPPLATAYAHRVNEVLKSGGDPAQDPIVQHLSDAITALQKSPSGSKGTITDLLRGGKEHNVLINPETGEEIRDLGERGEKPSTVNVNPGTWSLQNDTSGKPVLFNSKTGETKDAPTNLARKPNAEELKRNDLAGNVNENLNKLQDIVVRRPELFGPLNGRMTKLRENVGTSDPDVAALKTIEDNLGMALQSAHGMRSAQHVETSAQSVLNGLKNSPAALSAAIKTARESVGTFQHDVQNTNEAGRGEGAQIYARDPQGKLHQAPAGTQLPEGWKQEQR